jgi:hypothetical protein
MHRELRRAIGKREFPLTVEKEILKDVQDNSG